MGACPNVHVYSMRMARVNITISDELLEHARAAGLNVSRLAAAALAEELDRLAKIAALDAYLAEMDAELGPVPDAELQEAAAWADGLIAGRPTTKRAGSGSRQARSA
jgi:post-segregation antitoxin (ccd killing protein)